MNTGNAESPDPFPWKRFSLRSTPGGRKVRDRPRVPRCPTCAERFPQGVQDTVCVSKGSSGAFPRPASTVGDMAMPQTRRVGNRSVLLATATGILLSLTLALWVWASAGVAAPSQASPLRTSSTGTGAEAATPGKRRSAQRWPDIPRWCRSAAQHGPGRSRQVRGQRGGGPSRWAIPVKGGEGHLARRAGRNISRGSWDLGWHLRVGGGQGRQDLSVGCYRNKGGFSEIWFEQQPHRGHDPHDRWVLPDPGLLELAQDLLKPSCCPDVAARRAAIRTLFRLRGSVTRCTRSAGEPRAWDPGQTVH